MQYGCVMSPPAPGASLDWVLLIWQLTLLTLICSIGSGLLRDKEAARFWKQRFRSDSLHKIEG